MAPTLGALEADTRHLRRDVDRHEDVLEQHDDEINTLKTGQAVFGKTLAMYAAMGGIIGGIIATVAAGLVLFFITHHLVTTPPSSPSPETPAIASLQTGARP